MRVAFTVFGSTISPLFDAARRLVVAEVGNGTAQLQGEEEIGSLGLAQRMALLTRLRVKVLACGAISEFSHSALLQRGIVVYPWVSGEVQEVLGILAKRYEASTDAERAAKPTRLAIPTTGPGADVLVAPTFRRCSHLVFVDTTNMSWTATKVGNGFAGGEGCFQLARLIVEAQAQLLLTGRCGPNALGILAIAGVKVVQGVEGGVREAVAAFARGALVTRSGFDALNAGQVTRSRWGRGTNDMNDVTRGQHRGRQRGKEGRNRSRAGNRAAGEGRGNKRRGKGAHEVVHFDSSAYQEGKCPRQFFPGPALVVDADKCSGCRVCEAVCPTGAIRVEEETARVDLEKCIRGGMCIEVCPERALSMSPRDDGS